MPKLFSVNPSRLGYVCDDYDDPVHDLATGICYRNFCEADAAGVRNWEYGCEPLDVVPVMSPEDMMPAAPSYHVPAEGPPDESGTWIGEGGPPWHSRRHGAGAAARRDGGARRHGGGRHGGGRHGGAVPGGAAPAPGGAGPTPTPGSGGTAPGGRRVAGGPAASPTIFTGTAVIAPGLRIGSGRRDDGTMEAAPDMPHPGARTPGLRFAGGPSIVGTIRRADGTMEAAPDMPHVGRRMGGGGTVGGGTAGRGGIRSNPPGSGRGVSLLPGAPGDTILATAGRPGLRLVGAGPGDTLAVAYQPRLQQPTAAPMRQTMTYQSAPRSAITTTRQTGVQYQAAPQRAATTLRPANPLRAHGLTAQRTGSASRFTPARGISRSMRGLGQASTVPSGWQYAALGLGALVVAQFFWWNAKAPNVLKLGKRAR